MTSLDEDVAERVRMLRFRRSRDKNTFELVGTNSRLDAAPGGNATASSFPRLNGVEQSPSRGRRPLRRARARGRPSSCPSDEPGHVYHMYVVRSPRRDEIAAGARSGQASRVPRYYVTPLHLQPAMSYLGVGPGAIAGDGEGS